jgi:topoisomerase-4 subunit A
MAELVFTKVKGVQKENQLVDIENFIAVKGFKALGNQLTSDKLKQVNLLEPLPFEEPEEVVPEELEVEGDTEVGPINDSDDDVQLNEDGQITLF